ncbi:MAG: adenylosuccinate lyase [Methanomassiliicoccus sp.]|nr:adenylosuccinate lyase [Methanomassiliicoccus sp.]
MLICPLDYRYGRKEMKAVFSEENRLRTQLLVEAALARAHAQMGDIPQDAAEIISAKCTPEYVKLERVKAIEAETKHDVMSMVNAISEQCGDAGRYVHLGATSNDIVDTAAALEFKDTLAIIERDLDTLIITISALAFKHRRTVMMGRTHGQFAIPTTFGFKVAGYISELLRHRERVREMRPRVCVGKMSGAIGTGAGFGDGFFKIQELVMKDLGLGAEEAATQLVNRDRYAELVFVLSLIATSCERYATEVRNLQRSEIGEVAEAFDAKKQVGSSTMAQKKNPMLSENISGLARVVRSYVNPQMECMVLWHERDLSNSSAERFILPHVAVLTDDILGKMNDVFGHLSVNEKNMRRNIEAANGFIMAEAVLLALAAKGLGRQEAHELVRKVSLKAEEDGKGLKEALRANKTVTKHLSPKELDAVMNPDNYVGKAPEMVDRTVARAEAELGRKII